MADNNIIQNSIHQLGQNQLGRRAPELDPHFADIDERTTADLLRLAKRFADRVRHYSHPAASTPKNWANFFPDAADIPSVLADSSGTLPPHLALFIAFLKLYEQPQAILNQFTGRHLDFYYQEVLRLSPKPASPDKVHVLIDLKKAVPPLRLSPSDLFSAGKDPGGPERFYAPTRESVLNSSKVAHLRSIFRSEDGMVRHALIANSADGLGSPLPKDSPRWSAFGHGRLIPAEIGIAVAAPVLRMKGGTRKVTVSWDGMDPTSPPSLKFRALVTGEKEWITDHVEKSTIFKDEKLQFSFWIPADAGPVVDYDPAIHGGDFRTGNPVLKLVLIGAPKNVSFGSVNVEVEVTNITDFVVEGDLGPLNPRKPFQPFGPQPVVGSSFSVLVEEVRGKSLTEIGISGTWMNVPTDFREYYKGYPITWSPEDNRYFTASVAYMAGSMPQFGLFGGDEPKTLLGANSTGSGATTRAPASTQGVASAQGTSSTGAPPAGASLTARFSLGQAGPVVPEGPFLLRLILEKDFFHAAYRKGMMMIALKSTTADALNEPYTPTLQSLVASYKAASGNTVECFHVGCFGPKAIQKPGSPGPRPLLPEFGYDGEFLVGIQDAGPGDSLNLLFQVAEGSANPDAQPAVIDWFVLASNEWKGLGRAGVSLDTTQGLRTSGIIRFVMPQEATRDNTLLLSGFIWLRAGLRGNPDSVCKLMDVAANAVELTSVTPGPVTTSLGASLTPGRITRLKSPLAAVKAIRQPYASFAGRPAEDRSAFHCRVSERLRHKDRCITPWDYERAVLEAFPGIHMAKCIPHARRAMGMSPDDYSWMAPGHVMVVVVPTLRNQNAANPLEPRVDAATLADVRDFLMARTARPARITVINPRYQHVQAVFKVQFQAGLDFNHYHAEIHDALVRFLSPWAFDANYDIAFGGRVYKSVLLDFVEGLESVDYVTEFDLRTGLPQQEGKPVNVAQPIAPDVILVSHPTHRIDPIR